MAAADAAAVHLDGMAILHQQLVPAWQHPDDVAALDYRVKCRIDAPPAERSTQQGTPATNLVAANTLGSAHPDLQGCLLEVVALRTQLQARDTTIATLQQHLKEARAEAAQLETQAQEHEQQAASLKHRLSGAQDRITARFTELQSASARATQQQAIAARLAAENEALSSSLQQLQARVRHMETTYSRVRARSVPPPTPPVSGDVLLARVQWRDDTLRKKDALLAARTSMLRQARERHEQEVAALRQEVAALRQEVAALRQENTALHQENAALGARLDEAENER